MQTSSTIRQAVQDADNYEGSLIGVQPMSATGTGGFDYGRDAGTGASIPTKTLGQKRCSK